jgi:hypothetical protein
MKPKLNPNYPSTFVLICTTVTGLLLLAFSLWASPYIIEWLRTGHIYSSAVVFTGDGRMVDRSTSPVEYWLTVAASIFGGLAGIVLGATMPIGVIRAYSQKRARQKKERESATR